MKPVKGTSSSRAKTEGRRRKLVTFKELDETKSGETWFEYSTNSYLDQKTKREIKRERHHKLIEELRYELSLVQDEIEKSSPGLTSNLQNVIDENLRLLEEKYQYVKDSKIEHADVKNSFNEICAEAKMLSSRRKDATENFYKVLIDIEGNRTKRIIAILDKFRDLFARNDYLEHSEIKTFFDFELMNVNDGMLKNVSYYDELRDQYNISTDRCFDSLKSLCKQKIASWEESLTTNLRSKLKMAAKLNLSETPFQSKQILHLQLSFDNELKTFKEKWNPLELILTNQKTFQPWFETLARILDSLDHIAHDLLQEYGTILEKIYNDWESEAKFVNESCSSQAATLFQPCLKALKEQTETSAFDFKFEWGALIFNFLEEIDSVKRIFCAAENFKRKYNESLVDLQSGTYNQIFSEKENSTSLIEKEEDNNLEELVKRVKASLNAETAGSIMAEVNTIYEGKKIKLQDSYNKAMKVLDAFLERFKDKLNFLRNEIKTSITSYEEIKLVDVSDLQEGKPDFLLSTHKQLKRIQESRTSILNFLVGQFPTMLENECTERAKVWILSKRQTIRKNFEEETFSLSSRLDYFQSAVFAPRLQEISEHAEFFSRCKETLKESLSEIEAETSKTLASLNDVNEKFNTWIESTQKRSCAVYKSDDVQSILSQVFEREEEFKRCMREITDKYIETVSTKEEAISNTNFDLVQNLLSLAEQNVYTNEEIAVFCDEFLKLERTMISQSQNLKGDILQRSCSLGDESRQQLSLLIESLQQHKTDLSFTETVVQFVQKSKTELKEHAFSMKWSGKLLRRQIEELTQVVTGLTIWPDNAEKVMLERWKSLLETLKNRRNLLMSKPEENASSIDELKNEIEFSSYENMEFNFSNSNNLFLSKVHDILRKSMIEIENVAKNYYMGNQSRKSKPPKHVHDTYDDLMTEIMLKYNKYVQQCHLEWFKEMCDFVDTVAVFKEGITSYVVRFVSNLHEPFVEIMNLHDKYASRTLATIHESGNKWIRETATNLKPTHGQPENKQLLNNLKVHFDSCCSMYELMSEEAVTKYTMIGREILETASKDLRLKLGELRSALHDIFDIDVLRSIIDGLKEEFETLLVPKSSRNRKRWVILNGHHPNSINIDLVSRSVTSRTAMDKLRVESIRLKLIALAEEEGSRETLLDKIEEGSISQFLQNLREIHTRISNGLTEMDSAFKFSIKEARFEWDINVRCIKSMFTLPTI